MRGSSTLSYSGDEVALGQPGAHEGSQPQRQRRAADERLRLLLGGG